MMIGKPHRTTPSTRATRCILTLLAMASLSLDARAQQLGAAATGSLVTPAAAQAVPAPRAAPTDPSVAARIARQVQQFGAPIQPPLSAPSQPVPEQPASPKPGGKAAPSDPSVAYRVARQEQFLAELASAPSQPESDQAGSPSKPGRESVKVHGHWKIIVHNPDGSFVKQTEFENSLATPNSADVVLSEMMSGAFTLAGWSIDVSSSTSTALCPGTGYYANINSCFLVVANPCFTSPYSCGNLVSYGRCYLVDCFTGMTETYVPYNSTTKAAANYQLLGNFTPPASGPITSVSTTIFGCVANSGVSAVTVNQCLTQGDYGSGNGYSGAPDGTSVASPTFTSTTLPTPLNVIAGQVVTIIVTISFS